MRMQAFFRFGQNYFFQYIPSVCKNVEIQLYLRKNIDIFYKTGYNIVMLLIFKAK